MEAPEGTTAAAVHGQDLPPGENAANRGRPPGEQKHGVRTTFVRPRLDDFKHRRWTCASILVLIPFQRDCTSSIAERRPAEFRARNSLTETDHLRTLHCRRSDVTAQQTAEKPQRQAVTKSNCQNIRCAKPLEVERCKKTSDNLNNAPNRAEASSYQ